MPDTISLFTCGDTEPGSAGFLFLLLCPSFLGLSKPPPYPERDFYPVLHTFLQDKGLFLEALQITCIEGAQLTAWKTFRPAPTLTYPSPFLDTKQSLGKPLAALPPLLHQRAPVQKIIFRGRGKMPAGPTQGF